MVVRDGLSCLVVVDERTLSRVSGRFKSVDEFVRHGVGMEVRKIDSRLQVKQIFRQVSVGLCHLVSSNSPLSCCARCSVLWSWSCLARESVYVTCLSNERCLMLNAHVHFDSRIVIVSEHL